MGKQVVNFLSKIGRTVLYQRNPKRVIPASRAATESPTLVYGPESVARYGNKSGFARVRTGFDGGSRDDATFLEGINLASKGISVSEFLERPGRASAAPRRRGGSPEAIDVPREEMSPASRISLRAVEQARSVSGGANIPLEVPSERVARAQLAQRYFNTDSTAGPVIRSMYEFVIGPGFDVDIEYGYEEVPAWFNANAPHVQRVKRSLGPGALTNERKFEIFMAYLNDRANRDVKDTLKLEQLAVELARDTLVSGDAFAYIVDAIEQNEWENVDPQSPNTEEFFQNYIYEIQGLNPIAVELEADEFNEITAAYVKRAGDLGGGQGDPIPELENLIHIKWQGNGYTLYGTPVLTPALQELQLKEALIAAAMASANRYAVPIRLAKYGMDSAEGPIAPPEWRDEMADALTGFNPARDILVGPFHWDLMLIGADGQILDISGDMDAVNQRIITALGLPASFLSADFSSFAAAKVQMQQTMLKLRMLQQVIGEAIERIYEHWAKVRGYRDPEGNVIKFKVNWKKAYFEGDPEVLSTLRTLASIDGQEVMSPETMQEMLGLNSETEMLRVAAWQERKLQRMQEFGIQPNNGMPGQQQTDENGNPIEDDDNAIDDDAAKNNNQNDVSQQQGITNKNKAQADLTNERLNRVESDLSEAKESQEASRRKKTGGRK